VHIKTESLERSCFFADSDSEEAEKTIADPKQYPNGPYHWRPVMRSLGFDKATFPAALLKHYPVVTHTAAVEARALDSDCFNTLTPGYFWEDWILEMYDYFLGKGNTKALREGKYLHIHKSPGHSERVFPGDNDAEPDCVDVSWENKPST